jgi:hypothetical protein
VTAQQQHRRTVATVPHPKRHRADVDPVVFEAFEYLSFSSAPDRVS